MRASQRGSFWHRHQRRLAPWLFLVPGIARFALYVMAPIFQPGAAGKSPLADLLGAATPRPKDSRVALAREFLARQAVARSGWSQLGAMP